MSWRYSHASFTQLSLSIGFYDGCMIEWSAAENLTLRAKLPN